MRKDIAQFELRNGNCAKTIASLLSVIDLGQLVPGRDQLAM